MKIRICKTQIYPRTVRFESESKPGVIYSVCTPTNTNDVVCDCPAFNFRGECKHIKIIEAARCTWLDETNPEIDQCPFCGSEAVEFETEPELK